MLLEVQWENCYTTMNMDIQLCCFLAGIYMYVCICLVARINQRVFRNSSLNVFYARARQMMPVAKQLTALRWS